jgi:hypothetical protein
MRDPDLVQRSERAATALEQAWLQWSARHGLGTGSLPPVSSYVGYSMDEPWGQPRVVFGLDAEQAERLAAVLNRDESAGPAAAAAPGRRNQDTVPWSWSVPGAAPGVPAQASEPGRPRPESARLEASRPESARPEPSRSALPAAEPPRPEPGRSEPTRPANGRYETDRFEPERYEPARYEPVHREPAAAAAPARFEPATLESVPTQSAPPQSAPTQSGRQVPVWSEPTPALPVWPGSGPQVPVWSEPAQRASAPPVADVPAARSARPVQYAAAPAFGAAAPAPTPAPAQAPARAPAASAPAGTELDATELAADDLTAEQPILPLALRRAAAVADQSAELPSDQADALQELAAKSANRPGIVALRRRQPEPQPGEEMTTRPWWSPGVKTPAGPPDDDQAAPTRLNSVSRLNRMRRPAASGQDTAAWSVKGSPQHTPTDTAV